MIDGSVLVIPKVDEVIECAILPISILRHIGQVRVHRIVEYRYVCQRHHARSRLGRYIGARVCVLKRRRIGNARDDGIAPKPIVVRKHGGHHFPGPEPMRRCRRNRYGLGSALRFCDCHSREGRGARKIYWCPEADP